MMVLLMGFERMGVVVSFRWTNVGVEDNEKDNAVAKSAVSREGVDIKVPLGCRKSSS
jgi:hypothetical protein